MNERAESVATALLARGPAKPMSRGLTNENAADAAMETYEALRQHRQRCPQCHTDTAFCDTFARYQDNFQTEYHRWKREHERQQTIVIRRTFSS